MTFGLKITHVRKECVRVNLELVFSRQTHRRVKRCILLGRIAVLRTLMRPFVTDRLAWSVYVGLAH